MSPSRALGALMLALSVLGGACAIEADAEPRVVDLSIPPSPLDLVAPSPTETPATVYLISSSGELVGLRREVAPGSAGTQLRNSLEQLIAGPTDAEAEGGVRTAVPVTTQILDVVVVDGTASVDFSSDFLSIGGASEILAIGQIVVTATTQPGVQHLSLLVEGEAVAIPLPNGALSEDPVELGQYASLLAPGQPATTTTTTTTTPTTSTTATG